jgi:hypothetical protein
MTSHELSDYVLNPYTKRLIKIDSKTHKRLVSAQLLEEPYVQTPDNTLIEADTSSDAKQMQAKINKKAVGQNKVVTRRNNKVLTATRRPKRNEIIEKVTNITLESVLENKDKILEQDMTDDQLDNYIRLMISNKLVGNKPAPKKTAKAKKITTSKYALKTPQNSSESEYEENEEL